MGGKKSIYSVLSRSPSIHCMMQIIMKSVDVQYRTIHLPMNGHLHQHYQQAGCCPAEMKHFTLHVTSCMKLM